jgi:uncharacterized phage infection (PIP) family protein YhgE
MKIWSIIFRVIIAIMGVCVLTFNVLLYNFYEQQKKQLDSVKDRQEVESEFNTNKFKYQQDKLDKLAKDLEDAQRQIREQDDYLSNQKDEDKNVQTTLVDIKAEADAIKQEMKGWQKDYVSVLAELEKKMDSSQDEIKKVDDTLIDLNIPELKDNINSLKSELERKAHTSDIDTSGTLLVPEKKTDQN